MEGTPIRPLAHGFATRQNEKGRLRTKRGSLSAEMMPVSAEHTDNSLVRRGEDTGRVLGELTAIRADMVAEPAIPQQRVDEVHANSRDSARNISHYLTLRR